MTGTGLFLTVVPPSTNAFGVDGNAGEMVQFGKFMKTMQKDVQTTISTFESFNKTSEGSCTMQKKIKKLRLINRVWDCRHGASV